MSEIKVWGAKAAVIAMLLCLAQANALADFTFDIGGSATRASARGTDLAVDLGAFSLATLLSHYDPFDFDNSSRLFAFTRPYGSGSFDLSVTNLMAGNFSTALRKGRIKHISASPEPAAILLTSAFMLGVMVLFRKRLGSC